MIIIKLIIKKDLILLQISCINLICMYWMASHKFVCVDTLGKNAKERGGERANRR